MDKYRLIEQKEEIHQMARKAPVLHLGEIWQTLPNKREVFSIVKMEVLSDALVFESKLPFEFEASTPVYIRINYKNLIFKLMPGEYKSFRNMLSCAYPKEAKAMEMRTHERVKLPKKSHLTVTLRSLSSDTSLDIKVNLENVSEKGLGVKSINLNSEYFERNTQFKVALLCGREIKEEAVLKVRHVTEKDNKAFIGIGLAADIPFSEKFFEILREELKRDRFSKAFA